MLTVECAAEEADALLESILVTYPVMFSASINNEAAAQKTPVKLILKDNHIETVDNNLLGMLHDAYVTPVDVSGLTNLPTSTTKTDKYVIFYLAAGSNTPESCYVCKAIDDIC
jgi:hypothetical protein